MNIDIFFNLIKDQNATFPNGRFPEISREQEVKNALHYASSCEDIDVAFPIFNNIAIHKNTAPTEKEKAIDGLRSIRRKLETPDYLSAQHTIMMYGNKKHKSDAAWELLNTLPTKEVGAFICKQMLSNICKTFDPQYELYIEANNRITFYNYTPADLEADTCYVALRKEKDLGTTIPKALPFLQKYPEQFSVVLRKAVDLFDISHSNTAGDKNIVNKARAALEITKTNHRPLQRQTKAQTLQYEKS